MNEYQSSALGQIAGSYIFPLAISALYFYKHKSQKLIERLLVSAHGVIFVIASLFAVISSKNTSIEAFQSEYNIFLGILVTGILVIFYSFYRFNGSKLVHLTQALNITIAAFIWFVGGMTLSHDWI